MKEQNSIPTSKVARATQFVKTGVKIGEIISSIMSKKSLTLLPQEKSYTKITLKTFMNH
jgi:hypothetical protein